MVFDPFSITTPHVAYVSLGGFVVLFGMFSLLLREKLYIGEANWAFIFGVIIGPHGANIFNPRSWGGGSDVVLNNITLEFTRVVLAIGVFAIGVELPKAYMVKHWKSLFFLLVPVMTWGWFVSAALIYALIPGLTFLCSLAVAACLTPTDPILAAAVVGGKWADKHVPAHIRHLLAAESGCNDGAAFPFLYISLYLIIDSGIHVAVRDWFLLVWLYQIIFGTVIGVLLGYGFRHLMKFCQRYDLIDRHSYVAQYVSLAMLTVGTCTLLGVDDLLASFACGTTFAWDGFFNRQTEESNFSSVIDLLFNIAAFVFVGAWMPFDKFNDHTLTLSVWRLIVLAILVLLLKRLPVMVLLYKWIPDMKSIREAIFSGHFGPMGVGGVFISTLAAQILQDAEVSGKLNPHGQVLAKTIQPIVAFMVLCSIVIHGLSIPSFSLGRRVRSVSRTWSRHAPPDWTIQTRLVERGAADIVINRDSAMEEGRLAADEKVEVETSTKRASTTSSGATLKKSPVDEDGSAEKEGREESDSRKEFPADGTEKVMEWQEPHLRIIERREGPGDDVEVEVREEDDPELTRRSSGWSLGSLTGRAKDVVQKTEEGIAHEPKSTEETKRVELTGGSPQKTKKLADERVEDWASDYSKDEGQTESPASTRPVAGSYGARKKSGKTKPGGLRVAGLFGSSRKGKRAPLRRTHSQPVTFINRPHSDDDDDDDDRGRSGPSSAQLRYPGAPWHAKGSSPRYGVGEGHPRNQRIQSIRALSKARDESPSRSVRFIDEGVSRPGSASRSLAVSQVDVTLRGDDELESPRSRAAIISNAGSSPGGGSASAKNGVTAGGNNTRS